MLVQTLVLGWLHQPEASLGRLSQVAAALGVGITPQGLDQRFTPQLADCLEQVLATAVRQVVTSDPVAIPVLAIAGSMVGKKVVVPGPGTFPTNGALFTGLLVSVVVIVGALTFFPALSLGPIVEHYLDQAGKVF